MEVKKRIDKRNKAHGGVGREKNPDLRNKCHGGEGRMEIDGRNIINGGIGRMDTRNIVAGGEGRMDTRNIVAGGEGRINMRNIVAEGEGEIDIPKISCMRKPKMPSPIAGKPTPEKRAILSSSPYNLTDEQINDKYSIYITGKLSIFILFFILFLCNYQQPLRWTFSV